MKKLFTEGYLECSFDEDARVLFHVWTRKPTSEEFRNGLTKVYNEYINHQKQQPKPIHWLGDTRLMGVLSLEDQSWLDKVWNEMLFIKAGVKAHAVIIGKDVFAKYAMEKFKKNMTEKYAAQNLHMDTFEDKDAAYAWFKSIDKEVTAS